MGPLFLKDLSRSMIFIPTYHFFFCNGNPLFEGFKQVYDIHTYLPFLFLVMVPLFLPTWKPKCKRIFFPGFNKHKHMVLTSNVRFLGSRTNLQFWFLNKRGTQQEKDTRKRAMAKGQTRKRPWKGGLWQQVWRGREDHESRHELRGEWW